MEAYKTSREKLKAIHIPCGREIFVVPNSFISRGSGCKFCNIERVHKDQTKSHEDYIKEIPENITPLEKYSGAYKKIEVHCNLCDNTYKITARDLIKSECTRCAGLFRRTIEDVKEEVREITFGNYTLLSNEYTDPHTHLTVKHNECNSTYKVSRHNFRRGRRCPYCSESVGETLVRDFLLQSDIEFVRQKTFDDLKYKRSLSYDFYLPQYNVLIEYQGEQHYKPVKYFGGTEQFAIQCKIDNMKRKYAKDEGYTLIEVPYKLRSYQEVKDYILPQLNHI